MKRYVCIDIGGTAIKYGIIDDDGNIIANGERKTEPYKGAEILLGKVKDIVNRYRTEYEISGICVSTAGMVDPEKGKIIYSSGLIPDYIGTEIKWELEEEFGLNCEVENDVNCAGLGEMWKGVGNGSTSCVCLTIGTGIGGCIIIDNKVIHGFSNSAGEVGYMNMNGSTFQKLAATSRLIKNVAKRKKLEDKDIDGKMIFDLAKEGDIDCIEEIDNMVEILAVGISNIVYIINPEIVILGGGIMVQQEYLRERIEKSLSEKLLESIFNNTKIEFAKNGNSAGMLGALYNFKQRQGN